MCGVERVLRSQVIMALASLDISCCNTLHCVLCLVLLCCGRKVYGLKEVNSSHVWNGTELCFGDGSICNNGLTDISSTPYILSFGQDESGTCDMSTS